MCKSKRVLALICSLVLLFSYFDFAARAEGESYAFVKTTRASLYSSSAMSSRSRYIYKYEIVSVLTTDNVKARVEYNGKNYYIALKDIAIVSQPMNQAAVVSRNTYVYSKPSTSASRVSVSKNLRVTVLAVNGSWAIVESNGNAAYIKTACLSKPDADQPQAPAATQPTKDSYDLGTGASSCDLEALVTTASLSVYAKASASSTKLGTLKKNTQVHVYAYNGTWAYIELEGHFGYCKKAYLKVAPVATPTPKPSATPDDSLYGLTQCDPVDAVTNAKIKVYAQPDTKSTYLGYISKNTQLQVIALNAKWALIELAGRQGYTLLSGLKKLTPTQTPTPAPTPTPTPAPTPTPTVAPTYTSTDPLFLNTSTTNEQKIYEYLTAHTPYNEAVACGILANIKQESNFSPTSGKNSNYQGLCQWSTTRFAILVSWCEKQGFDPYSLEGQIKFLYYDLSQRYTLYNKALLQIENTSEGAYEAGYYFCYHYERPASLESSSVKRGTRARDVYWVKYAH